MKNATLVLVTLALLLGSGGQANGGLIGAEVEAKVNGDHQIQTDAMFAMVTAQYSDILGDFQTASALSRGSPGVFVSGSQSSNTGVTQSYTQAIWRDNLILSGPANTVFPTFLDLHFSAAGHISLDTSFGNASISVGGGGANVVNTFISTYSFGSGLDQMDVGGAPWDTIQFGGGSFSGTWHEHLVLSPDAQGNRFGEWYVNYSTTLNATDGFFKTVTINGNDPPTFSFDTVTLPDGHTPESEGLTLGFESGITSPNATAVPEPATMTLLGIGIASLAGYGWRRRKQTVTA